MDWIKKNVALVVGIVVALVAMVGAGYYLVEKMDESAAVGERYNLAVQRRDGLVNKKPNHPGFVKVDNVKIVKDDIARLTQFESDLVKGFKATIPVEPTERGFKQSLADTIAVIENETDRSGLTIPTNFNLSFTAQKIGYRFASNSLGPLTVQLADLTAVAKILVDARVNSIESFKRVAVSEDDSGDNAVADEYINNFAVTTNSDTKAIIYPYEVSFRCFSEEFGDVLEGIAGSPYSILVKTIEIEPANVRRIKLKRDNRFDDIDALVNAASARARMAADPNAGGRVGGVAPGGAARGGRADSQMSSRYGGGKDARPLPGAPAQMLPGMGLPPAQPTGPETLLQPEPLKVTLGLAVVHMPEATAAQSAKN